MRERQFLGSIAGIVWLAMAAWGQVGGVVHLPAMAFDSSLANANIRVDSELVLVPVTVCDPMNRPVTGLEKARFRVFDRGVEQTVTHFGTDDAPIAVGLVFDVSGSMRSKLRTARLAAAQFFKTANPDDEFFLVEFNDWPRLVVPLTQGVDEIENQLAFSQSSGRTALLDALALAMHEAKKSRLSRKALLIISDGGDNCSRYTTTQVRRLIREGDVLIYAIDIYETDSSRSLLPEEMAGPWLLSELAKEAGGREFPATAAELPDIAASIGIELRNRYVLGYSPTSPQRDGRYHSVQVELIPPPGAPPLKASWRRGYYAPAR